MSEQMTLTAPVEADRRSTETDARERGDDPTPRPLVREILAAALPKAAHVIGKAANVDCRPVRVLDVCAGYGCWASEVRRWWALSDWRAKPLHITAIECYAPRLEHLRKWSDDTRIGKWQDAIIEGDAWDIVVGNPNFKSLVPKGADVGGCMPAVLLGHAAAVLLFHQTTSFQRGMIGAEMWRRYLPTFSWRVPGSVGFRGVGNGGTDQRCYQATLWLRQHAVSRTFDHMLPNPPDGVAQWRWSVPPGSEEPCEDLPGVVGWQR